MKCSEEHAHLVEAASVELEAARSLWVVFAS